jgi:hypothetical protein
MPPFVLVCLPWTRARSKVRFTHILRALTYALAPVTALLTLSLAISILTHTYHLLGTGQIWRDQPWFTRLDPLVASGSFGFGVTMPFHWACLAWYLVYWWCVLKRGWRMDDHRKVFFATLIPALLLASTLLLLVPGFLLHLEGL